jgi:hypothetical protein
MLDISVEISLSEKSDIDVLKQIIVANHNESPVYIIELNDGYQVQYGMPYDTNDIQRGILINFPDYEFTEHPDGRRKVRMVFSTRQSPFSTDDWGRALNTDYIEHTYYLVRKRSKENTSVSEPNTTFKVLFGNTEKEYTVHVFPGINKVNNQEGFIVVKSPSEATQKPDLLVNKLFNNSTEAFWGGHSQLAEQIEEEFALYQKSMRRKHKKK